MTTYLDLVRDIENRSVWLRTNKIIVKENIPILERKNQVGIILEYYSHDGKAGTISIRTVGNGDVIYDLQVFEVESAKEILLESDVLIEGSLSLIVDKFFNSLG